MAATVIDELIVALGFDASGVEEGRKKAASELLKFKNDAGEQAKQMTEYLNRARNEVLSLFAAFTAGKGLREFIQDTVQLNNQLSRLSYSLGQNIQEMSQWRGAGELVGSSADDISGSIAGLTQEMQNAALTGQSSLLPFIQTMGQAMGEGFSFWDQSTGKVKSATDFLKYLAAFGEKLHDPARSGAIFKDMGLSQGMINLINGPGGVAALQKMLELSAKFGVVTEADAKAAQDMQLAMMGLHLSSESLGRTLLTTITPALVWFYETATRIAVALRAHPAMLYTIAAALGIVAAALTAVGAAGILAWLGITGPILVFIGLVAAAGVAIGLFLDDIKTWSDGGKSEFGSFYTVVGDTLNLVKALFTGNADDIRGTWSKLIKDLKGDVVDVLNFTAQLTGGPQLKVDSKGNIVSAATYEDSEKQVGNLWSGLKIARDTVGNWAAGQAQSIHDAIAGPPPGVTTPAQKAAWEAAVDSQKKFGVPASVTYAQWQLESGNGKHMPAGSNNPFGIKATSGQPYVSAQTNEVINGVSKRVTAKFAKYATLQDAFDAHAKLLATSPKYSEAQAAEKRGWSANDYVDAMAGVYATDPNYGTKIKSLMAKNGQIFKGNGGVTPQRLASSSVDNRQNNSNSAVHNTIGQVTVVSQATDAKGIARDFAASLDSVFVQQANGGAR